MTNVYGENGRFYLIVKDPTQNNAAIISQSFGLPFANDQQTFSLRVDQNNNPVSIKPGVTYALELETYGFGVCGGAFSNYTLALTGDLMFTNLGSLPSGASCSSATTCSGFLPPSASSSNTLYFTVNTSGTSCPVLVDPVPALTDPLEPNLITQNFATLAGRPVASIAADGVTRLVLRIPAITATDQIYLSVINDQNAPSTSVNDDGGLDAISGQNFVSAIPGPLTVTQSIAGSSTYMAFALYQAPIDFVRASQSVACCDFLLATRTVNIQVQDGQPTYTLPISIVRPPVVLVHGLTASTADWNTFTPFISNLEGLHNKAKALYHSLANLPEPESTHDLF